MVIVYIYQIKPIFGHGKLYVEFSRRNSKHSIKVKIVRAKNVKKEPEKNVFKKVL